ncbi:MAG: iron ABC transporter permease [Bacteroidales bacterium]|nr:MAG: iron ABC transporter permease [Bacteroidales bacterium]
MNKNRWAIYLLVFTLLLLSTIMLSLSVGEIHIPIYRIFNILSEQNSMEYGIMTYIRIPRTLLAFAIGGGLSLVGGILQGIYRNPLVEPYTLGISGGASLGVTIGIVFGLHLLSVVALPIAGFVGALFTLILVYMLSSRNKIVNINKMLLIGVMISFVSSSMTMFFMSITTADNIHSIVFWTMGSLNESNKNMIAIMVFTSIFSLFASYLFAIPLNALQLGELKAKHLGIDTNIVIRVLFILTSLLTGTCIAVGGIIGFVGLVVPHIVRILVGNDYRILLISSFLCGSIFLIMCDVISRIVISPNELPIGVVTGICGGIFFIILLSRWQKTVKNT